MDLTHHEAGASPFYIPATVSLLERRPRTLKHGDTFALFDHYGDLSGSTENPEGLFHRDTRFLSECRLSIEGRRPLLISSSVQKDNILLTIDLTNPDIYVGADLRLPRDTVHVLRSKFLWDSSCYEAIILRNYSPDQHALTVAVDFAADFADVFEVRGHTRAKRGHLEQPVGDNRHVLLRYAGLDGGMRETGLVFAPAPARLHGRRAEWSVVLKPRARQALFITTYCGNVERTHSSFLTNLRLAHRARHDASRRQAGVRSSNHIFNELLSRSTADLAMLTTATPQGPYPYAGIPWFSTAFGRDGLITAIEMLAVDPALARGVLDFLAAHQAREFDQASDAEPGKILHETRQGEMAVLGEVPFGRYYGSVDSTPLFVLLAALYWRRTGDTEAARRLWPAVLAALAWIDCYGDADGDGFVEYRRTSANGLSNQGWKDSNDSIFHADGALAQGSIALCEVQAYVYAAKSGAAEVAAALGERHFEERLRGQAEALRVRFEEHFWMEDAGCYALALDGEKRPCRVIASNAGHALFGGIAAPDRAARVARHLVSGGLFSGWGIRTLDDGAARYNPMSYHNGSVWPHDNALIGMGLARYGHMSEALLVLNALSDASTHMELRRLPELFCGIRRKTEHGPTFYPVACSPQAWASAAPFALLTAVLGLELDGAAARARFVHPRLPDFVDGLELRNLRVGSNELDVSLHRRRSSVAVEVVRKSAGLNVEVVL